MGASRIELLTNEVLAAELLSLYNSLKIAVDDPSYSLIDSKKLKLATLLAPLVSDINTNAANIQANEDDILVNIADIQALEAITNVLNDEIPWAAGTNVWGGLQGDTSIKACKVGKIVYVTGIINADYTPSENTVLFTLPPQFPNFTETVYFNSGDGNVQENGELKALLGTRSIVAGGGIGNDSSQYFCAPIPVI